MKFAMYQDCVSPHQRPLAKNLAERMGEGEFRYVYRDLEQGGRVDMGWNMSGEEAWLCHIGTSPREATETLEKVDCLLSGMRDVGLFERRAKQGLVTLYQSERWFKPWMGILRLLKPSYFKMAWRWVKLLRTGDRLVYLPMGIHAARDMARLCGLMAGDWRCLFRAPELAFERNPGGRIWLASRRGGAEKYCLDKMRMWGYFVEPSTLSPCNSEHKALRVLWVGRLLNWKRMDTIIRAVLGHGNITLDICGSGPMEGKLKAMARGYEDVIKFYPPVPIDEVRKLMREHDVYVLASNGYEGWGAVVSEALEEGMRVIGTYEAGSSATILPESQLFHAGDWRRLRQLLVSGGGERMGIGEWTAKGAAEFLTRWAEGE